VAWILGPEHEIELVRRIFHLYATRAHTTWGLEKISQREGWVGSDGLPITRSRISRLLHNEAVIGNFVWGRSHRGSPKSTVSTSSPVVSIGAVPEVIDEKTWALVQERLKNPKGRSRITMIDDLRRALAQDPYLPQHLIRKAGCMDVARYREEFGSFPAALLEAGADLRLRRAHARTDRAAKRKFTIAFGDGLAAALSDLGVPAGSTESSIAFCCADSMPTSRCSGRAEKMAHPCGNTCIAAIAAKLTTLSRFFMTAHRPVHCWLRPPSSTHFQQPFEERSRRSLARTGASRPQNSWTACASSNSRTYPRRFHNRPEREAHHADVAREEARPVHLSQFSGRRSGALMNRKMLAA